MKTMELPFTFADFALTEGRFSKQFRRAPEHTWDDQMIPLHEFLDMDNSDRDGLFPYIMATDKKNHLTRVIVSEEMVKSCDERRHFWRQLRSLTGVDNRDAVKIATEKARSELAGAMTAKISELVGSVTPLATSAGANLIPTAEITVSGSGDSVWIETHECTSCDECLNIAPGMFSYNDEGKAVITNPQGASYKDVVKAAEKCTAGSIHPGVPWDQSEKDLDKLVKRAEKYQ